MTPFLPLWLVPAIVVVGLAWSGKHGLLAKRVTFAAAGAFFLVNAVLHPDQRYPSLLLALVATGALLRGRGLFGVRA